MVKPSRVEEFVEAVNSNPELARDCAKALDGSKNPKKFVALAAKHGYKFTEKQAESYFKDAAEAPSADSLSKVQLRKIIGAKVEEEPGPRGERLKNALSMLRGMNFKKPPTWTVFSFAPSRKRG